MSIERKEPKSRVVFVEQDQFRREEYWNAARYVDHDLDPLFEEAEQDPNRPQGVHIGWWAFRHCISNKLTDRAAKTLWDIPFRYEGELDIEENLTKIISETQVTKKFFDQFYWRNIFSRNRKTDLFEEWTPEGYIARRFFEFYNKVGVIIDRTYSFFDHQ